MPDIPTGATAGAIAKVLKITERVVAGRKADGRLPVMPGGAVDLHALVRAGAAAMAHRRPGADTGMTEPERFDAGMRAAVGTTAHITAQRLAKAGPGAPVAAVIHAAMDEARELLGLPADAPG
jgi:hypothetical protein